MAAGIAHAQELGVAAGLPRDDLRSIPEQLPLPTLLQSRSSLGGLQEGKVAMVEVATGIGKAPLTASTLGVVGTDIAKARGSDVNEDSDKDEDMEDEVDHGESQVRQAQEAQAEGLWSQVQQSLQDRERIERVWAFLKQHGFSGVNSSKGWAWNHTYPLHCAAALGDVEMVQLLLASHALRRHRDSSGRTARQVAKSVEVKGSHSAVTEALLPKRLQEQRAAERNLKAERRAAIHEQMASTDAGRIEDGGEPSDKLGQDLGLQKEVGGLCRDDASLRDTAPQATTIGRAAHGNEVTTTM